MFVNFMVYHYLYVSTNVYQSNELSYIVMEQTSHPRNNVPKIQKKKLTMHKNMAQRMRMIPKYHCSTTRTLKHHNLYPTYHITHISTLFSDCKPSLSIMVVVVCSPFLVCIPHVRDLNVSDNSAHAGGSKIFREQHTGFNTNVLIQRSDVTVNCT